MATKRTLEDFERVDKELSDSVRWLVPVQHDKGHYAYSTYKATQQAPATDKMDYAQLLGADPKPVVTITDEDVQRIKDQAMMARIADFDRWVGAKFSPYENPANRETLKKIYPQWFESQRKAIDDWHKLKQKMDELEVVGPTSKEDLYLLWKKQGQKDKSLTELDNKLPGLRNGAIAPILTESQQKFRRGVFNRHNQYLDIQALGSAKMITGDVPEENELSAANVITGHAFANT